MITSERRSSPTETSHVRATRVCRRLREMYVGTIVALYTTICVRRAAGEMRDFSLCHDDFSLNPTDGVLKDHTFPWLGFVQYIHVTTGLPHHSKAPRVVLVQKQFVVGTATDLLHLPKNYKLGNIVFGDYERDEEECSMTRAQIKEGARCPRSYLEVPLLDITPHPEFSRFGVGNSLALVKLLRPMKSHYMIPVCLPSLVERMRQRRHKTVYLIDYISTVPRDFDSEKMAKKSLKLYTHSECKRHRLRSGLGSEGVTQVLCSSGCGVRPGAPLVVHALDGRFELLGLAAGGAPCSRRSMRRRLNREPPLYIDVFPFTAWITNVITAHRIPLAYPQHFKMVDGGAFMSVPKQGPPRRKKKKEKADWNGRTFLVGDLCFRSRMKQRTSSSYFYYEQFEVTANPPAKMNIEMKMHAGPECIIKCVRMMMPNRLMTPEVDGLSTNNISVTFDTEWFPFTFYFGLILSGANNTEAQNRGY